MIITEEKIRRFERYLYRNERSVNTVSKYLRDIRTFANGKKGRKITKSDVLAYKAELAERFKISSANSMIAALNSFFKFFARPELCVRQYKVQRAAFVDDGKELRREEYERLVNAARRSHNERLALLLQTVCATGIRISELKFITVEAARCGRATVSLKGKTRIVFLIAPLAKRLLRYAKEKKISSGEIFVTKSGRSLNRSNIWKDMKALCAEAGVAAAKVFPHNLRHLFARTFYGIEKDIVRLADILGHSSINTTRIYVTTSVSDYERRMKCMKLLI